MSAQEPRLLDRDAERAAFVDVAESLQACVPRVVLVGGVGGIGKTALLREAARILADSGVLVLTATGGQLEQGFDFGVVRQLFEPLVAHATPDEFARLLSGAGRLAAPIVAPGVLDDVVSPPVRDEFSALHGLYWLAAGLAAERPVALLVDDAQWADAPSLRYLIFLARRFAGLPIAVLACSRPTPSSLAADLLDELAARPGAVHLEPSPLSEDSVSTLIRDGVVAGPLPSAADVRASTGGVPYLVLALLRAVQADPSPAPDAPGRVVAGFGAREVASYLLRSLSSAPAAARLAQAVAVLGRHAPLTVAADLAALSPSDAAAAADHLVTTGVLADSATLQISHPILAAALYGHLSQGRRARDHGLAARLLAAAGDQPHRVAAHVLRSPPGRWPEAGRWLREAAAAALRAGGLHQASEYLERALTESLGTVERAEVLHLLGRAQIAGRHPDAARTLHAALDAHPDPSGRAEVAVTLILLLVTGGRWGEALVMTSRALDDPSVPGEQRLRLATLRLGFVGYGPVDDEVEVCIQELLPAIEARRPHARAAAAMVMGVCAAKGRKHPLTDSQAAFGLDVEMLVAEEGPESPVLGQVEVVLGARLDVTGLRRCGAVIAGAARRASSVFGTLNAAGARILAAELRGDLVACETELRLALELAREHDVIFPGPSYLVSAPHALAERAALEDIREMAASMVLEPALAASINGSMLLLLQGRLDLRAGRRRSAVDLLRRAGTLFDRAGFRDPVLCGWRTDLAYALLPDGRDEARALAREALDIARELDNRRAAGVALRTLGLASDADAGVRRLRSALELFEDDDSVLEAALTRIELGALLRRTNARAAARDLLRLGIESADRCGASASAARGRRELEAAGGRVTHTAATGPASLTPGQRRVSELAAEGLSNPEIAQALFITRNTVESHLRTAFQKLGARSRQELAALLVADRSTDR